MTLHPIWRQKVHPGISALLLITELVFIFFVASGNGSSSSFLSGAAAGGAFGGRIISTIPCTCSPGTLVLVGPPRGGYFMRMPSTRLYSRGLVLPGRLILGMSGGYAVCLMAGDPCSPIGSGSVIIFAGTN
jgi:hypothetical protein